MSTAILKDLREKKLKPLYLLHGEEPYYIDKIVAEIEQSILTEAERGFNQTILYGKDTDMASILNIAKRYPMMSDYQVVVVKEAQDLKWVKDDENNRETEMALHYFENPLKSTILVLAYKYGTFDKRKKIYKAIDKNGVVFKSDMVRDYQLATWIETHTKELGYKIAPQAAALIAEYLGTDLSKIANEIEKLTLNINKDVVINTDHVQQNIGISKDYNVFELQKAIVNRNVVKCNQIINYFADNPKSNPMVMVIANLNSFFTKVLKYHYLQNKADAARELGIIPFFVKDYEYAARAYPINKIFHIIGFLREYDLKSKGVNSTGNTEDGDLLKELLYKIIH